MPWSYDAPSVRADKDAAGHVRIIRHLQTPFPSSDPAETPRALVVRYVDAVRVPLGLAADAAEHLHVSVDDTAQEGPISEHAGVQVRWRRSFEMRHESTVFLLQQTHAEPAAHDREEAYDAMDVEGAGLRILLHRGEGGLRVTSVTSTLELGPIEVHGGGAPLTALTSISVDDVLKSFGFAGLPVGVRGPRLSEPFIHRFRPNGALTTDDAADVAAGRFYPAQSLRITPSVPGGSTQPPYELVFWPKVRQSIPPHTVTADSIPLRRTRLTANAAACGCVFLVDPATATGDVSSLRRNDASVRLDTHRRAVTLENLAGHAAPWTLAGTQVEVLDTGLTPTTGGLGAPPPSAAAAPNFFYHARTNEFAAVNAYYHLDTMLTLLDTFGLPFTSFPMRYVLPLQVIHRAGFQPGPGRDGKTVNGQTVLVAVAPSIELNGVQIRFGLADLARNPGSPQHPVEPLGIACDVRVVWHEFCHALIAAATSYLEFPFAHSAGDALGAIQCDPESGLARLGPAEARGITFPWGTGPARRHMREAADGWSWTRPLGHTAPYDEDIGDMFGYVREQILSSTLFRLYGALGGDATHADGSPHVPKRQRAADYATYLVIRAINSLGSGFTAPAKDAAAFATMVMEADVGTIEGPSAWVGGAAHKAVEWAFAQQGLPPPPTSLGVLPDDVFLEDGRHGGYQYAEAWQADGSALWVRNQPDGQAGDQAPVRGVTNYVYVSVGNCGGSPAQNVSVSVHAALDAAGLMWPAATAWQALHGPPGVQSQAALGQQLVFGPFPWRPAHPWRYALLAIVESDADPSNLNPAGGLACTTHPTPVERLVRLDNNLGLRVFPVV